MIQKILVCCLVFSAVSWVSFAEPDGECPEIDPPEQPPTILPDLDDCGSYYVCNAGEAIQLFCSQGTYWNIADGYCVKGATAAHCGDRPTTPTPTLPPPPAI